MKMKQEKKKLSETASLRHKAEEQLSKKLSEKGVALKETDILKLVHELEVHQIELEMQNEELRLANDRAETAVEKYTAIYDFAPMGYFTLDREGTICELNLSGATMLGKERSGLINRNFKFFVSSDTHSIFNDFLGKVFETGLKQSCTVTLTVKENVSLYVHFEGIVSENEQQCLLTAADITHDIVADEDLHNSETRYRRLFESAKDGILILDANSGQILDVNPFLVQMIRYSREEILGKELWEIGTFKNIANSKEAFIELQNKGYIRFDDMPLKTQNGKTINVEFISNVYREDHAKVIQCNIRDITERKLSEEKLKENETRLHELNATKDKFFSIIAHDLKSPFNAILGFSDLLEQQIREKDYKSIEKSGMIIHKSSMRAMNLLKNLLEWARSQTGKMNFTPENIEIVALINQATELLKPSAQQKSINLITELPNNAFVSADKAMIGTVLRNLISNAVKFTYSGGEIIISAKQNQNELIVTVSDNGVGIKKETIEKLFRIDESYSTTGTENEKGTGLGLILCMDFINKHGGKIWVESEPGKGSKFHFKLSKTGIKCE